jgi:2,3-bisphosphoglycerate-independent phosphoglycerate mutase
MAPKPTILMILDGWGISSPSSGNAITGANPKYFNYLTQNFPTTLIQASGEAVGVSWGEMGNSEVGHLNIGAGRIVYQNLMRITKAIEDRSIQSNQALLDAFKHVKKNNSRLHFIGLTSDGGVHSYLGHLYGLLEMTRDQGVKDVFIHAFLDGRDTKYNEGVNFISRLNNKLESVGLGKIATLSGRFYAMDRDNHWERIEKTYRAMAEGVADNYATDPIEAIKKSYDKDIYDEEFIPTVIRDKNKKPIGKIEDQDAVIFFNFRPDRSREITKALVLPSFDKFNREYIKNLEFVTLTEYEKKLPVKIAFEREDIPNSLGKVISDKGLKQLHIAETEKYAHITYFLNGGVEEPFPGEDNVIIPSPRVPSYANAPEMSAKLVSKRVTEEIMKGNHDFIAINFANADMVGHTGNIEAAIKAVQTVDAAVKEIVELTLIKDGCVLITADHGNAEDMINERIGEIEKEHTSNPVPLLVVKKDFYGKKVGVLSPVEDDIVMLRPTGVLADIAPTILKIMEIKKPKEMQGISLV